MIDKIKKQLWLRRKKLYFLYKPYKKIITSYEYLYSLLLNFCIWLLRFLLLKNEIVGLDLYRNILILKLDKKRKFYWEPLGRKSLINLGIYGALEKTESDCIERLVKPGQTIISIGSNFGFYTVLFSRLVGKTGQVHAFEPQNEAFSHLNQNIILNSEGYNNVFLNNCGLGERNYFSNIYTYSNKDLGYSSLRENWGKGAKKQKCKIITLDYYIKAKKIKKIDFIKCDIEGAELLAFKGGHEAIKKMEANNYV